MSMPRFAACFLAITLGGSGCRAAPAPAGSEAPASASGAAAAAAAATTVPLAKPAAVSGPDIADVGAVGEARSLVAVAGKITVFDFWAPWCEPCAGVAAGLAELEASHGIAVRKLEIADSDDPASVTYLNAKGFGLPHLKIYDASGKLLGERSGGVSELMPWVKGLIEQTSP